MPATNPYDELYDRIDKTACCRFNASRRLLLHNAWSQWMNVAVSVTLVAIPLAQAYRLPLAASDAVANYSQVFLAVAILTLTIQFGTANFSMRAEKLLDCGKELQALMHRVSVRKGEAIGPDFEALTDEYAAILAGYENQSPVDYRFAQIKKNDYYGKGAGFRFWTWIMYLFAFLPYTMVLTVVLGWTLWLLSPIYLGLNALP
jgi:hypothetical protein